MPTMQQQFDTVLFALREQGVRSVGDRNKCLYRGFNGTKCAVGHLIPDHMIDEDFGNLQPVGELCKTDPVIATELGFKGPIGDDYLLSIGDKHQLLFLRTLQRAHDEYMPMTHVSEYPFLADWDYRMKAIAENFNLVYTPPNN